MLSTFFVGGIYKKTYGKTAPAEVASALRLEQLNQQTPKSLQQGIASSGDGDSKTLRNAFNGEFFEHYSLLSPLSARIKWCADNWDRANYYAPYTCLVQSSGSGKSRTVVELGRQKCWLFYVCFRKPGMSGYPPRSFIADNLSEPLHFRLTASKSTLINRKEVIDYCTIRCIEVIYYVCIWTTCIRQLRDDLLMSVGVSLERHRRD
jgi:hypothetical protein